MPGPSTQEKDRVFIKDILEYADKAFGYVSGLSKEAFMQDELRCLAVTRLVEITGEAASQVSKDTKLQYPEVPWREMADTRNKAIHNYTGIDYSIIYDIATVHLPEAVALLRKRNPS